MRGEMDNDSEVPVEILRKLIDSQEQNNNGGKELQKYILSKAEAKNMTQLEKVITFFERNYIRSATFKNKKIGLEVFTYIAVGLKGAQNDALQKLIFMIVNPVLMSMNDADPKIRFTAIKSMYYITRTMGDLTFIVFNDIFDNLVKRVADEEEVRESSTVLNQILMTSISSNSLEQLNVKGLIDTIVRNIKSPSHHTKHFLVDWLDTLNEIPSLKIIVYMELFLGDLFVMLDDKELAVKNVADRCLHHFLEDLKRVYKENKFEVIFDDTSLNSIISTLINVLNSETMLSSSKLQAITWFKHIFNFFKEESTGDRGPNHRYILKKVLIDIFDEILEPILKLLSYNTENVRSLAGEVNEQLLITMQLVKKEEPINFNKVMPMLKQLLNEQKSNSTSDCILAWMKFMLENYNNNIVPEIDDIIQKLVEKLCEGSSKNVMGIIQNVSFNEHYFEMVIEKLLHFIKNHGEVVKPHRVLKHLCNALNIEKAFCVIASQLKQTKDRRFASDVVSALLHILVTTENNLLQKMRQLPENLELFKALYECFCANPPCTMALCFLTNQYQLAYESIRFLCLSFELNYLLLEEFCRIACMLESNCFIEFRMDVLGKEDHPYLEEALTVLLMVLPYGLIQAALLNRLNFKARLRCKHEVKERFQIDMQEYMGIFEKSVRYLGNT